MKTKPLLIVILFTIFLSVILSNTSIACIEISNELTFIEKSNFFIKENSKIILIPLIIIDVISGIYFLIAFNSLGRCFGNPQGRSEALKKTGISALIFMFSMILTIIVFIINIS